MTSNPSSSNLILNEDIHVDSTFHLEEEIPSEGFNRLVVARRYGKRYLLKALKEEYASKEMYRQLLKKEFEMLISLSHPNIVHIEGFEQVEEVGWCIVEEYIEGEELDKFLKKHPTRNIRLKIAEGLIDALVYTHKNQIAHRDLKPANILITHNGENPKLIDFGLSDTDSHILFKQPAGTPKYISPEQLDASAPDCRNDIYSLGKILQELDLGVSYRHCIRKCLKPIEERYPNAEDLRQDLEHTQRIGRYINIGVSIVVGCLLVVVPSIGWFTSKQMASTKERINTAIEQGKQRVDEINRPYLDFLSQSKEYRDAHFDLHLRLMEEQRIAMEQLIDSLCVGFDDTDKSVIVNALNIHSGENLP